MLHCLGYAASITNNVATDITPMPDGIMNIVNGHFQATRDLRLQAAIWMNVDADRARIVTPALRQLSTPYIRPVEGNLTPGNLPGVADYRKNPIALKALEEISVEVFQNGAGAANGAVFLFVSDGPLTPMPAGTPILMRGTSTTAAVANSWTLLAMTWADNLPAGMYAVVGMQHVSATGKAARLIFEETNWRPGTVSTADTENRTHEMFTQGGMGEWGRFTGNRMPNIEVACNTTDNAHEVYLEFIKV